MTKKNSKNTKRNEKRVLVLRTCAANMESYNGFKWPQKGAVECHDWLPTAKCGNGLHGFLWGEGNGGLADWAADAKWLVVSVLEKEIVVIDRKVKFPRGNVVFCGGRKEATDYIAARLPPGRTPAIVGHFAVSGDRGTSNSGVGGTSTSGHGGTSTSGDYGTSTSGDCGTSTSGYRGTSTSGDCGTSTSGDRGTSTSGDYGTSSSGDGGTSTSGEYGTLMIKWYDSKSSRYRTATAYVGENGIKANVKYRLDSKEKFEEVK